MANNTPKKKPSGRMHRLPIKKKSNNPIKTLSAIFGKKVPDLSFIDDETYSKLEKDFLCAAYRLEDIKKHLVEDQWLIAYSLYKQATEGDCKAKKPSKIFKTRLLKHEYWCRRYGMPTDVAAKRYVKTVAEYDDQVTKVLDLKKAKSMKRPGRKPRKVKARAPRKERIAKQEARRGSVIPLTAEEAPASYEEGIVYAKPIRRFNRARASVEVNKFLSVRLSSTGAAFGNESGFANFGSIDKRPSSVLLPTLTRRSTVIFHQPPARTSVRATFLPTEDEFKRFTLVRNSTIRSVTSTMTFQKPSYYYHGPSLEKLVALGQQEKCPYKGTSAHVNSTKIDEGYHDFLPVIHLLKVEFSKEIEKSEEELDEQMKEIVTKVPLDRFMLRLIRYIDRWFEEKPSINSAGARSLIISKIYIESKLKKKVDDLAVNQNSIYKLLAVCMLLAAKYCEDCLIANTYWAEVSGLPVKELNRIEQVFLDATDYDLFVTNEDMISYGSKYHLAIGASPVGKMKHNSRKPSRFAQLNI